ncbi:MAG: hypothetical protein SVR94_15995, partial [Pseudomonadota bacterium]|nr:hypothetical protein [Pseudomonadota bacterium]
FDFTEVRNSISQLKGWETKDSKHGNIFEIHHDVNKNGQSEIDSILEEIREILLLFSLKHKIGYYISSHGISYKRKGQPYLLNIGSVVKNLKGIDKSELQNLKKLISSDECREAIHAIRDIHSQINDISKITVGWTTIEDLFNKRSEHILDTKELECICGKIEELNFSKTKVDKIIGILKNPNLLAIKSRNERIAENISDLTGESYKVVDRKVKDLAEARGKLVHNRDVNSNIEEHLKFILNTLRSYLNSKGELSIEI